MKVTHILLTTDFSEESRRAYPAAADLAKSFDARLTLLHVVPDLKVVPHGAPLAPMQPDPEVYHDLDEARKVIDKELERLPAGTRAAADVVTGQDVAHAVAEYCEKHGVDWITVSTHGRSGFRRLILGSTAEAILRHSKVPVLCLPPQGS